MACLGCGAGTKAGVLMCKGCLEGILDPLSLVPRLSDPMADMRLHQLGSAMLRIGPVASSGLDLGEGVEPALRLRSLMEKEDEAQLPAMVEEYLAMVGITIHLWGDERVPRRAFLWRLLEEMGPLEIKGERWARASVRMGNLHALMVLVASDLPLDEEWQSSYVKGNANMAVSLYQRAKEHRPLFKVARSNQAMLYAWMGRTADALSILEDLRSYRVDKETAPFTLKRAMVLCDAGRREECLEELSAIPDEHLDSRGRRFKEQLEGKR